jgi:hypothetical protein
MDLRNYLLFVGSNVSCYVSGYPIDEVSLLNVDSRKLASLPLLAGPSILFKSVSMDFVALSRQLLVWM